MILIWLIGILLLGGILAALAARWNAQLPRWISLIAIGVDLILTASIWAGTASSATKPWLDEVDWNWVPSFGIHFHLAVDGLSLLMLMLTFFLGIISVLASWTEIREKVGFFHFNLMWVLAGIAGVFLAVDLFLFYFAWELMLVPMYFLIVIWGHERRVYAAVKFFLFTQCSGLLMLIAILALYFIHHQTTGVYTFEYSELLGTQLGSGVELWIMLGFFVAFAVKLPVVPLHTWLPDAHTEAPTAGSVILAGLLLKTGAYGMMRFVIPLFPHAAHEFTPVALVLAVIGIVYGAVMAFSQTDLKRLVAYTSVSHLGFVLLGIFSWNPLALQGAIMTMICHGLSTGATLRSGRWLTGTYPHSRSGTNGRPLDRGATLERSRALLQSGLARPAGDGRFRRGVSRVAGLVQNQRRDHSGREPRDSRVHFLCAAHGAARLPGPQHARLAASPI